LAAETSRTDVIAVVSRPRAQRTPRPARPHAASAEELSRHRAFLARMEAPLWSS
jgi:DNA polymerase-3 subunit epsilon